MDESSWACICSLPCGVLSGGIIRGMVSGVVHQQASVSVYQVSSSEFPTSIPSSLATSFFVSPCELVMSRIQFSVTIKHDQPLRAPSISLRTTNSDGFQHGGMNLGSVLTGISRRGTGLVDRERVEVGVTASKRSTRLNFCVNTVCSRSGLCMEPCILISNSHNMSRTSTGILTTL